MNMQRVKLMLAASLFLLAGNTFAAITGATVTSTKTILSVTSNNLLPITWRITTDSSGAGVNSTNASTLTYNGGSTLTPSIGAMLSGAGVGTIVLNETISMSAAQVSNWQNMGINRIRLRRAFTDPADGSTVLATLILTIPEPVVIPDPVDPGPVDPGPVDPGPVDPGPVDPGPIDPGPVDPGPIDPGPINPGPVVPNPSVSSITAARVTPTQRQLFANQESVFNVNWQVVTGSGHSSGVISSNARIINPRTSATLATINDTLSETGVGPYLFSEVIALNTTDIQSWIKMGLNRVILERTFQDPAGASRTKTHMILLLSRSKLRSVRDFVSSNLNIENLRLEFATGNNLTVTQVGTQPRANLTVVHSGSGLLEGRWQVAEPGSTEGEALYRTLALVRKNLLANQRTTLKSPALPAARTGKYLLRFCVTNRNMVNDEIVLDNQCPIEKLLVDAAYQVQGKADPRVSIIQNLKPNQASVNINTPFSWQAVPDAKIYQLQLFKLGKNNATLPSEKFEPEMVEPQFITGMVIPAKTTKTVLSELVRAKLQPNLRYLWRVTAHDASGRLIASSADPSFIYQP